MRSDRYGASIYIGTSVKEDTRSTINNAISRYLFLRRLAITFSSKFILLVTYNNITRYGDSQKRFTFQVALVSDGVRSFAVCNYARLDTSAAEDVRYFTNYEYEIVKWVINNAFSKTKYLALTSNIGVKGMHVIPLKGLNFLFVLLACIQLSSVFSREISFCKTYARPEFIKSCYDSISIVIPVIFKM